MTDNDVFVSLRDGAYTHEMPPLKRCLPSLLLLYDDKKGFFSELLLSLSTRLFPSICTFTMYTHVVLMDFWLKVNVVAVLLLSLCLKLVWRRNDNPTHVDA